MHTFDSYLLQLFCQTKHLLNVPRIIAIRTLASLYASKLYALYKLHCMLPESS